MRQSLRRSCAACARSKHSCDLRTPRCSRCIRRTVQCVYANEPLGPPASPPSAVGRLLDASNAPPMLSCHRFGSFDPFESYPKTRLRKEHVQRLIYNFLNKIAFQYYPLDLDAMTNPFLVSWWPLALGDPALFHVSLQTACLDEELMAQKGFQSSDVLMTDSVALLRRKVEDVSLAIQDGTMNSVITLATIEFGKGNVKISEMHVEGVKRLVHLRGGINSVRQTSPLTARMISWVSLLIMGCPQFQTQDDCGMGDGIPPVPEWQASSDYTIHDVPEICELRIDAEVRNVFQRLRNIFQLSQHAYLSNTRLHDLACFVIHRLLLSVPDSALPLTSVNTERMRYATILYMFIVHGPTYYSHTTIMETMVTRLMDVMRSYELGTCTYTSFDVWLSMVGMVASAGTVHYRWFLEKVEITATSLCLASWKDVFSHLSCILWLDSRKCRDLFHYHWEIVLDTNHIHGSQAKAAL